MDGEVIKCEMRPRRGEDSKDDDYSALRASFIGTTCLSARRFAPRITEGRRGEGEETAGEER